MPPGSVSDFIPLPFVVPRLRQPRQDRAELPVPLSQHPCCELGGCCRGTPGSWSHCGGISPWGCRGWAARGASGSPGCTPCPPQCYPVPGLRCWVPLWTLCTCRLRIPDSVPSIRFVRCVVLLGVLLPLIPVSPACWSSRFPATPGSRHGGCWRSLPIPAHALGCCGLGPAGRFSSQQ